MRWIKANTYTYLEFRDVLLKLIILIQSFFYLDDICYAKSPNVPSLINLGFILSKVLLVVVIQSVFDYSSFPIPINDKFLDSISI
jgi:hypothetical protein